MRSEENTVDGYLKSLPEERRIAISAVRNVEEYINPFINEKIFPWYYFRFVINGNMFH
jgi:hypothetical protein